MVENFRKKICILNEVRRLKKQIIINHHANIF